MLVFLGDWFTAKTAGHIGQHALFLLLQNFKQFFELSPGTDPAPTSSEQLHFSLNHSWAYHQCDLINNWGTLGHHAAVYCQSYRFPKNLKLLKKLFFLNLPFWAFVWIAWAWSSWSGVFAIAKTDPKAPRVDCPCPSCSAFDIRAPAREMVHRRRVPIWEVILTNSNITY